MQEQPSLSLVCLSLTGGIHSHSSSTQEATNFALARHLFPSQVVRVVIQVRLWSRMSSRQRSRYILAVSSENPFMNLIR